MLTIRTGRANGMFKKKKVDKKAEQILNEEEDFLLFDEPEESKTDSITPYVREPKDIMAPQAIVLTEDDTIKVDGKYMRSFVMQGYPQKCYISWLDDLYSYDGDLDTVVYIEPKEDRTALDDLTNKIAQYRSQLIIENDKGNIKTIPELQNKIYQLEQERNKIVMNAQSLYNAYIGANLSCDSKEQLEKETTILTSRMKAKRMSFIPTYLQMEKGFKSALPFGNVEIHDKFRNMSTAAVSACCPFYTSEIMHPGGNFLGFNMSTGTPLFLNEWDETYINNTNMNIFGRSGSGKTYFVSLLILRSAMRGVISVIIDPENEYSKIARETNGLVLRIAQDSEDRLNLFEIESEAIIDPTTDLPTGKYEVRVKDKISDLLNVIAVMAGGLSHEQISGVSIVLTNLYKRFGITTDPESLFYADGDFDENTGTFYTAGKKKVMPVFSDFHDDLSQYAKTEEGAALRSLVTTLKMFKKGGVYDLFDCQSTIDLANYQKYPIICFDVSGLEENLLRPIGMYIALSWTWEKFGKKNFYIKKRVVCDEAWMLVSRKMAGHEYTEKFLDSLSRRIRKRNGGLLISSQNFVEFTQSETGESILTNAAVRFFLKQSASDIDAVQKVFHLSDGERRFLLRAGLGEVLLKTETESALMKTYAFPFEHKLLAKQRAEKIV